MTIIKYKEVKSYNIRMRQTDISFWMIILFYAKFQNNQNSIDKAPKLQKVSPFKKQKYVSGQHRVNLKVVCKENFKYEVQERCSTNQAVTMQQLAEEYWR